MYKLGIPQLVRMMCRAHASPETRMMNWPILTSHLSIVHVEERHDWSPNERVRIPVKVLTKFILFISTRLEILPGRQRITNVCRSPEVDTSILSSGWVHLDWKSPLITLERRRPLVCSDLYPLSDLLLLQRKLISLRRHSHEFRRLLCVFKGF